MRILVVTDWPRFEGGTEAYVELLAEGLRDGGDEVRLLTSGAGSAAYGRADYVAYASNNRLAQAGLQVHNPLAGRRIRIALREFRPDGVLVLSFMFHLSPAVLGPLREVPTVLSIVDHKPVCPTTLKLLPDGSPCPNPPGVVCYREGCVGRLRLAREGARYGLFRAGLRSVDRVQTISRTLRDELAASGIAAEIVPPPVRAPQTTFPRSPAAHPRFVYAGRLADVKGVDVLLRALARLRRDVPEVELRVVGDGPERPALERLVRELGLRERVWFSPAIGPAWFGELEGAWALVAPSTYREPLGLVAIEAIVRRVPVIATDGGGFAETVEPGLTGLLVQPGDEEGLTDAMRRVAERRAFPDHLPDPARAELVRRRYDLDRHLVAMRSSFAEIAEERAAA
jgi:glycosyltransferase involved in cell wall biosynthesis